MIAITGFISIIFKFVRDIKTKNVETPRLPLIVTTVICVVFSVINYGYRFEGVCQGILIVGLLYLTYILFCYRKKIKIDILFNVLFPGIMASAIVSGLLYIIPNTQFLFFNTDKFILLPAKDLIFLQDKGYSRLMLLSYHPNHLNCYCLFIITHALHQFINNNLHTKHERFFYIIVFLGAFIVGMLTKSKAFLLSTIIVIIYSVILLVIKYKKKVLKYVIPFCPSIATIVPLS
jgi:hypothetical protein